jgi:hypothetical protein
VSGKRNRLVALALACCAGLLAAAFGGAASAARVTINTSIPPAKWKSVRLRNLPKDASVIVVVETSGVIGVVFVHQEELKRFPAAAKPTFQGSVDRKLSFRVVIPKAGNYYVILDNRRGTEKRRVRLQIQAQRAGAGSPPPRSPPRIERKGETSI